MIKAIIFDVDGVIIFHKLFSDRYSKKYNISHDILMPFFMGEFNDSIIGKSDLKKILPKYIFNWGWKGSIEELLKYWLSEDIVDNNMTQLINQLSHKGLKIYLSSNQEKYRGKYLGDVLGFSKMFRKLFFSYQLGSKKPEKGFFLKIYKDIKTDLNNIKKNEILFVDDELENIKVSNRLGFKTHHYKNFQNFKTEIAALLNE